MSRRIERLLWATLFLLAVSLGPLHTVSSYMMQVGEPPESVVLKWADGTQHEYLLSAEVITPTPEGPTPEPTVTPTPVVTPLPPSDCWITALGNVNVRALPTTASSIVGLMLTGSDTKALAITEDGVWYQIWWPSSPKYPIPRDGWTNGTYYAKRGDCDTDDLPRGPF